MTTPDNLNAEQAARAVAAEWPELYEEIATSVAESAVGDERNEVKTATKPSEAIIAALRFRS